MRNQSGNHDDLMFLVNTKGEIDSSKNRANGLTNRIIRILLDKNLPFVTDFVRMFRNPRKDTRICFAFDLSHTTDSITHHAKEEYKEHAKHQRGSHRADKNVKLFWLTRQRSCSGKVNNAHVPHFTGTYNTQLLDSVQHARINFVVNSGIFLQSQDFLLSQRHLFCIFLQLCKFCFQLILLLDNCLNIRMFFLEQTGCLLTLLFQLQQLTLQLRFFLQMSLSFTGQVNRTNTITIIRQNLFGTVQFCLDTRQLLFQEFKGLFSFSTSHFDILAQVSLGNGVQNRGRPIGITMAETSFDNSSLFTLFRNSQAHFQSRNRP